MVPLSFMDARRGMIHDGSGGPAGQRPGFLVSDNEAPNRRVEAAYRQYAADIERTVASGGQGSVRSPARSEPPQMFDESRKPPALPPMRNITGPFSERWRR